MPQDMHIGLMFTFPEEVPSRITILNKVGEISGLSGLTLSSHEDEFWSILHPDFTARKFYLYADADGLHVEWGWPEKWYLLDVTAAAIISLGGICNESFLKPSFDKWTEAMGNYPVVGPGRPSEDGLT